jgi:hypothetical protein
MMRARSSVDCASCSSSVTESNSTPTWIEHEAIAILSGAEGFIQCVAPGVSGNKSRHGYLLEYQDGSEDRHYRATDEPITLARVLFAFLKYLRGDASFRTDFRWVKVELERWNPEAEQTQVSTD